MTRTFALAALLSLSAVAVAQAGTLATRVHEAAVEACAVESGASLPSAHYAAITKTCVDRLSATALRKVAMEASARTHASTAALTTSN